MQMNQSEQWNKGNWVPSTSCNSLPEELVNQMDDRSSKSYPCYMEVFDLWKNKITKPYTWATILSTLRTGLVDSSRLAKTLEILLTS